MQESKLRYKYDKGEHRYKNLNSLKESFKFYKKKYPKTVVTKKKYNLVCTTFFKEIVKFVLEGKEFKLPFGLGKFSIVKRKNMMDNLKVDWKSTVELWDEKYGRGIDKYAYSDIKDKPLVRYMNNHTNKHYYRWFWERGRITNIKTYAFKPVRSVTKEVGRVIREDKKDFLKR
jgi:nucleoid DNA-binding protein